MAGDDVIPHGADAIPEPVPAPAASRRDRKADSPAREYEGRRTRHYRTMSWYARIERSMYRTKRVLIFSIIGYVVFDPTTTFLLTPLFISLVPLVIAQVWAIRGWRRTGRRIEFYDLALARIEHRWMDDGDQGSRYGDEAHPYALDLDIFGHASVFQLLCTARTPAGCDTLADWLRSPSDAAAIVARQQAVQKLRDQFDLREAWTILDADPSRVDSSLFEREPPSLLQERRNAKVLAVVMGVVLAVCLLATFADPRRWWPVLSVVLIVELAISYALRDRLRKLGQSMRDTGVGIQTFSKFARLVNQQRLDSAAGGPSARFGTFERSWPQRATAFLCRAAPQEPFFVWLWLQFWPDLERHHKQLRASAAKWFVNLGEFEALQALACYAFEHPGDPFPEVVNEDAPYVDAVGLGHPLIAETGCVRNDLRLDRSRRLIMVSGSNMSGKSTLLRSLGTNVALAQAGAPVRAEKLSLSPLTLGTAMRFRDSVHNGTSYFFAVVRRLKTVTDLIGEKRPLLFLFDEMLQGTNSHDRRVGAEAIVRMLIDAGAIGLITTHDLTLTEITDALGPCAANMHFEDQVADGLMAFDYKIKPGVVQKSNALELMRIAGLRV